MAVKPMFRLIDMRNHKNLVVEDDFRIESMKNTIMFRAGDGLSSNEVNGLIGNEGCDVYIRAPKDSDF